MSRTYYVIKNLLINKKDLKKEEMKDPNDASIVYVDDNKESAIDVFTKYFKPNSDGRYRLFEVVNETIETEL